MQLPITPESSAQSASNGSSSAPTLAIGRFILVQPFMPAAQKPNGSLTAVAQHRRARQCPALFSGSSPRGCSVRGNSETEKRNPASRIARQKAKRGTRSRASILRRPRSAFQNPARIRIATAIAARFRPPRAISRYSCEIAVFTLLDPHWHIAYPEITSLSQTVCM